MPRLLGPPPFAGRFAERHVGRSAALRLTVRLLQLHVGVAKSRGEDRAKLNVVLHAGVDDAIATFQRDLERLLDDDVFLRQGRRDGGFHVGPRRRGDDDNVHIRAFQDGVEIGRQIAGEIQLVLHLLGVRGAPAHQSDDLRVRYIGQGSRVESGDQSAANDGKTEHEVGLRVASEPRSSEAGDFTATSLAGASG